MKDHLESKLHTLLEKVDSVPVTRNQKLLLYKAGVCPIMLWDMGISDLPISWITKCLEATTTRYLKKWSGLAWSADPSHLYLPKKSGGIDLPNITTLYRKMKVSIACQLLMSCDPITKQVTKIQIQKEEMQKRAKFQPMLTVRDVDAADPGGRRQTIMKRAKNLVMTEDTEERLDHAKSLATQGQLHHVVDEDAAVLWSEVVQSLPPECMKFVLNAAQDTLPHNANLSVWRRDAGLSSQCKLCGKRQTLLHVLNHCQVALELRHFNKRHDTVLQVIADFLKAHCLPEYEIIADLHGSTSIYNFPSSIASTDLRPDLVVWSITQRIVILAELTVCFETNFVNASQRKTNKLGLILQFYPR